MEINTSHGRLTFMSFEELRATAPTIEVVLCDHDGVFKRYSQLLRFLYAYWFEPIILLASQSPRWEQACHEIVAEHTKFKAFKQELAAGKHPAVAEVLPVLTKLPTVIALTKGLGDSAQDKRLKRDLPLAAVFVAFAAAPMLRREGRKRGTNAAGAWPRIADMATKLVKGYFGLNGFTSRDLLDAVGKHAAAHFETLDDADQAPYDGTEEFAESVSRAGKILGCVTSSDGEYVRAEQRGFGIAEYFGFRYYTAKHGAFLKSCGVEGELQKPGAYPWLHLLTADPDDDVVPGLGLASTTKFLALEDNMENLAGIFGAREEMPNAFGAAFSRSNRSVLDTAEWIATEFVSKGLPLHLTSRIVIVRPEEGELLDLARAFDECNVRRQEAFA